MGTELGKAQLSKREISGTNPPARAVQGEVG